MKKKIIILGSTGSIGKTLFNILKKDKKNFDILLLTANKNINELLKQIKIFKVKNIIVTDKEKYSKIKFILKNKRVKVFNNFDSLDEIIKKKKVDYTMSSISGLEGLKPTLNLISYSKNIAIANKESIICAWPLIKKKLSKHKTKFIPVDSEHFSIYSLIDSSKINNLEKVFITASGGPFKNLPLKKFSKIKLSSALKHPNWKMGKKITIDSSTLMNKVFEIIEAKKIFDLDYKKLNILIHPKSYVHAMVKFKNGLTKILIHDTNMIIPIFNSLYPNKNKMISTKKIDFNILNHLSFEKVDQKKFPVVKILKTLPDNHSLFETIVVSSNDTLVKMFLDKKIEFLDISKNLLKILKNKEFMKYKRLKPKNVNEIIKLSKYVSLKIQSLSI